MVREYTNRFCDLIDEGFYDRKGLENLALDLLSWISEDSVQKFWYTYGYGDLPGYGEDDEG